VAAAMMLMAPAAFGDFLASKNGSVDEGLRTRGSAGTAGAQTFTAGPFTISCAAAKSSGLVKDGSLFMSDAVRFSHCTTDVAAGEKELPVPVHFAGPLQLLYEADLYRIAVTAPETIDIKAVNCTISLAPQVLGESTIGSQSGGAGAGKVRDNLETLMVPTRALRRFPSGLQPKLKVTAEHEGQATFGGACAERRTTAIHYTGELVEEVPSGSLSSSPNSKALPEEPVFALEKLPAGWVHLGGYIGPELSQEEAGEEPSEEPTEE
jgi:hypothetical protein